MTRAASRPKPNQPPFELTTMSLDHLEVERYGFLETAGKFSWACHYRLTEFDDDTVVLCLVVNEVRLYEREPDEPPEPDEDGPETDGQPSSGPEALIHMAHMVIFGKPDTAPLSGPDRDELVVTARMTVHPLLRAQVLSATSDLGFPPLTMPLVRRHELPAAHEIVDDDGDDVGSVDE